MSVIENAIHALKGYENSFKESAKVVNVNQEYLLRLRSFQSLLNAIFATDVVGGKNVSKGNRI